MTFSPDWPSELNISNFSPPARLGWRAERIELLQKVSAACRLFRHGLTAAAALNLARATYAMANFGAVAVCSWQETLAFVGPAQDSELPHLERICPAFQLCLETGKHQTCRREPAAALLSNCWRTPFEEVADDPTTLRWLVTIPLANEVEVLGALVVYANDMFPLTASALELARWVSWEANMNLELGRLHSSAGQVAAAELKALRAQISPHFLFNTLNSVAALIRVDADQARELIVDFADFFRRTLKPHGEFVTLSEELDYIAHYVRFETVRFGPALSVEYELAPETETVLLPLLTVQPLVENAIQHGIAQKIGGGHILIKTRTVTDGDVEISVEDNGIGIEAESLTRIKRSQASSSGLGLALHNINERLQKIYGSDYQLTIESQLGLGTKISFRIPRLKPL
jgi:two-component system LytT family sensor kinase